MEHQPQIAEIETDAGASIRRGLIILRRRWRVLAAVWALVACGTAVYTFTAPRLYRPQATLEVRPETPVVPSSVDDSRFWAGAYMWENYYRTQESLLTSPSTLDALLKALPEAIRREYESQPDPIKALGNHVEVEKVRTSFILKVGFVDENPKKAAQVVNALVSVYLESANRRLKDVKSSAAETLTREALPEIRKRVDKADKALLEFNQAHGFIDVEERYKSLLDDWRKVNERLSDRRLAKVRLAAEFDALGSYRADAPGVLFHRTFNETRHLERLAQDRNRLAENLAREGTVLKEGHPRIRQMTEEMKSIEREILEAADGTLRALETDLKSAELEEAALVEELKRLEAEIAEAGKGLAEYRKLDAELKAAKDLYGEYLRRHGDVAATSGTGLASVRVVDPARVPTVPYKPKVSLNLALGSALGLMLGLGAMFLMDQLDNRIRSAEEVEAFVGLEVLSAIPRLSAGAADDGPLLLDKGSSVADLESFRGLRTEVVARLRRVSPDAKVIAVLSALPEEGKSTVALNLAQVLAMEGRRVLLFDADMRRPMMSRFAEGEGPGLEDVLSGAAGLEAAARASRIAGVDVVGARKGTTGAAELAGSPRFEGALRSARERYDVVIIDSAPVIPAAESSLIASRADGALLVVREGRTGRGPARHACRRLAGLGVRMLGAVLNCIEGRGSSYGYGYYGHHYYYYHSYYGSDKDESAG